MTRPKATFECCSKVNISEDSMCNCSECKARGALTEEGKMTTRPDGFAHQNWRLLKNRNTIEVTRYRPADHHNYHPVCLVDPALLDWIEEVREQLLYWQTRDWDDLGDFPTRMLDKLSQIQQPRSAEDE